MLESSGKKDATVRGDRKSGTRVEADEEERWEAHLSAILSKLAGSKRPKSPVMMTAEAPVSSLFERVGAKGEGKVVSMDCLREEEGEGGVSSKEEGTANSHQSIQPEGKEDITNVKVSSLRCSLS